MTGPLGSQPATGRMARTTAIDNFRFEDGKVAERWGNSDGVGLLQQLGLQLPPSPAAAR
jgi:predicted ester cyclase